MGVKKIAYINPKMLVWARTITPFETLDDVSERIKTISVEKLFNYENGIEYPSISEAKSLAKLYKVPLACFFLTEAPERKIKKYVDRRTLKGTVYGKESYNLWSEIERILSNREKIIEYGDEILFSEIPYLPEGLSDIDTAEFIRSFLEIKTPFKSKYQYGNNSFSFFRRNIEDKGIIVAQLSGVSLAEMRGLSICEESIPIIAINNKDYDRAKTFTLIHEMIHIFRRTSSLCLVDFDERNDDEERYCDFIAANVLMPSNVFIEIARDALKKYNNWTYLSLSFVGDKFAVSVFSVIRRLYELKMINISEYMKLYDEVKADFEKIQKDIDAKNNEKEFRVKYCYRYLNLEGYLFPRTILSAYHEGHITFGEVCSLMKINSKHYNNIEKAVMY